ncbi:MAG: glycoside hydrolase family 2 [Lachnospiraceae bacterium]|jgi:beta-glucuronidase|nr:glycoside hydrolase family 2 [Lachnospiraceae bacterium]MCI1398176.1 glycoside hydrolase family 2 [Lachnospiraceae bacterium]MCI1424369.1 glycoside hydrolase family 2 [Lachnospiraceae bacterium]MCI1453155.1 glycoside hydrolase family 2 [Lachnospiraceae bacterium]
MAETMKEAYASILDEDFDRPFQVSPIQASTLVRPMGRSIISLDGAWSFAPDVFDMCFRKKIYREVHTDDAGREIPTDYDFSGWEKISVPSSWNTEKPEYTYFEGTGIYFRTFDDPRTKKGGRVLLCFEGANCECRLFLGGKYLGRHIGGFSPFVIDITDELRPTGNRLIAAVNNERRIGGVPDRNFDWWNYGGIFRSVYLLPLPDTYLQKMHCQLVPDGTFSHLHADFALNHPDSSLRSLHFSIPELDVEREVPIQEDGTASLDIDARPLLWSPEHPRCYRILARAGEDLVSDETGFCEIRTEGKKILLNGKELFLRGCCHEESSRGGRTLSLNEREEMMRTAREMGCNAMRLAHYPHDEETARLADRIGMLLWEKIPVYWALRFDQEETLENAENQLRELIARDYNHPSVILWSIGNETPDTDARCRFMSHLASVCREQDPTRLVTAACLIDTDDKRVKDRLSEVVDVVGMNEYYGWYYRDYSILEEILCRTLLGLQKPLVISETGAAARAGAYGGEEELFTENHQEKVLKEQIRIAGDRVNGLFPWILFDFRSGQRLHPLQGGYNRKGLVAEDHRTRKLAYAVVQDFYLRRAENEGGSSYQDAENS